MDYRIYPPDGLVTAAVTLPASKSITNRALLLNALTHRPLPLHNAAVCDDSRAMADALATDVTGPDTVTVNIGAAGTAMRFLTAYYAATPGANLLLDGSERMRQRPIAVLVDALRTLGADITYAGNEGYPPLLIKGRQLDGGPVTVNGSISSQYISALLMIGPTMANPLILTIEGDLTSKPYLDMTIEMMRQRGISLSQESSVKSLESRVLSQESSVKSLQSRDKSQESRELKTPDSLLQTQDSRLKTPDSLLQTHYSRLTVTPGQYQPLEYTVEPDWSAAGYWYEIQALASGTITLDGLAGQSIQGDALAAKLFADLGVVTTSWQQLLDDPDEYPIPEGAVQLSPSPDLVPRFVADMASVPDMAQTVAVTCALLGVPFALSGLHTLRIKETDRLDALCNELLKLGVEADIQGDTLAWHGQRLPLPGLPVFDTYDDHRMAMSLAPAALYLPGIVIRNADVVTKSYPSFWNDLRAAGFTLEEFTIHNS